MNGDGSARIIVDDIEAASIVELAGPSSITTFDSSSFRTSDTAESSISISDDQIAPLLTQTERPKINIFTISYPRLKLNKEEVVKVVEPDKSSFLQFIFWLWSGSRYSGLLCIVLSCTIYSMMEVASDVFTAQSVPLFEIAFARCTVVLILSFVWLRKSGQSVFGPTSARKLLVLRALSGCISLLSFIYSIQRLPVSQAIVLSFTAPIMASVVARVTLHEKLKIAEIGGLASSFFGVLFIFQPMVKSQGVFPSSIELSESHILAVLVGLFSSVASGLTYCLTRAGAKAADQPVLPVLTFALLASPAAAIASFSFENIVLPSFYSFLLMTVLGVLAFFAEITLARALQLEKTSRVANIQFIEVALSQFLGMGSSRIIPSFGRFVGCIIILISACCTMYIGPEKEIE
ncbi:hypothetical protein HAX54_037267 [Datura stramonium]|uniref:EamA domain-containing protein n=1 Tax=Datura stramonium TaxID=4076 RepID=A0ABS8VM22_DATST|nr:hypothetical protein [Datura stramonium]